MLVCFIKGEIMEQQEKLVIRLSRRTAKVQELVQPLLAALDKTVVLIKGGRSILDEDPRKNLLPWLNYGLRLISKIKLIDKLSNTTHKIPAGKIPYDLFQLPAAPVRAPHY